MLLYAKLNDSAIISLDSDGDGYCNDSDNCPVDANTAQADRDNNGIGDLCQDVDGDNKPFAVDANNDQIIDVGEYGIDGVDGADIDDNGNGLIDIWNINMLYNVRYNLQGTSYKTSTTGNIITSRLWWTKIAIYAVCSGYELMRNLDFSNDSSYVDTSLKNSLIAGSGWMPIGGNQPFVSIFDGNQYTISNLLINRNSRDVGFFGYINNADIRNVQLENVDVRGSAICR